MSRALLSLIALLTLVVSGCNSPAVTPEPLVAIAPEPTPEPAPQPMPEPTPGPQPQPAPEPLTPAQAYQAALVPVIPAGSLDTAMQAAGRRELRAMLIGDSITEGGDVLTSAAWGTLARAELERRGAVQTWNYALGQRDTVAFLRADYLGETREPADWTTGFGPRFDADRAWVQPGVSWYDQATFKGRSTAPNLYVVAFGVNEVPTSSGWKSRLTEIVKRLRALPGSPSVVIVTPEVVGTAQAGSYAPIPAASISTIAQEARAVAAEQGVALVDVHRVWSVLLGRPDPVTGAAVTGATYSEGDLLGTYPGVAEGDGNGYNHPSRLGHLVAYYAAVRELLAKLPTP